ncbi:MAG: Nif11-like leader peptide family natural product precursor [Desulfohalobiaceae bacterium]
MSKEAVKSLVERLNNDDKLLSRLTECNSKQERFELARAEGYQFSEQDINQALSSGLDEGDLGSFIEGSLHGDMLETVKDLFLVSGSDS